MRKKSIPLSIREVSRRITQAPYPEFKWWVYNQYPSGGWFITFPGVAHVVLIQAKTGEMADEEAQKIGIYFEGADKLIDCSDCGDRWYRQMFAAGIKEPTIYGLNLQLYSIYESSDFMSEYFHNSQAEAVGRELCVIYYKELINEVWHTKALYGILPEYMHVANRYIIKKKELLEKEHIRQQTLKEKIKKKLTDKYSKLNKKQLISHIIESEMKK